MPLSIQHRAQICGWDAASLAVLKDPTDEEAQEAAAAATEQTARLLRTLALMSDDNKTSVAESPFPDFQPAKNTFVNHVNRHKN